MAEFFSFVGNIFRYLFRGSSYVASVIFVLIIYDGRGTDLYAMSSIDSPIIEAHLCDSSY